MILVTGQLFVSSHNVAVASGTANSTPPPQVDEEQRPMNFSQAFQLVQDAQGQWFVYNDIFKLVFG